MARIYCTYLPIKAAISFIMGACDQAPLILPEMQDQISLTLCWRSFSSCGWAQGICLVCTCRRLIRRKWPVTYQCQYLTIHSSISSVSNHSGLLGCGPVRVVPWKTGVPTGFGDRFEPDRSSILRFLQLWLQLTICVLIVSWHGPHVNCSALAALSTPAFKFAIRLIFVEWLWNNGWIQAKLAGFRSRLNEYLSDRKSESGRRKSD